MCGKSFSVLANTCRIEKAKRSFLLFFLVNLLWAGFDIFWCVKIFWFYQYFQAVLKVLSVHGKKTNLEKFEIPTKEQNAYMQV